MVSLWSDFSSYQAKKSESFYLSFYISTKSLRHTYIANRWSYVKISLMDLQFVNNSSFTLAGWDIEGMEKEEHWDKRLTKFAILVPWNKYFSTRYLQHSSHTKDSESIFMFTYTSFSEFHNYLLTLTLSLSILPFYSQKGLSWRVLLKGCA